MSAPAGTRPGLRAAPWLLWFGVLGGAVFWSLHTVTAWSIDEATCRSGHTEVAGIPLSQLELGISLFFLVLTGLSTVVAWRHWRRLTAAEGETEGAAAGDGGLGLLRLQRASLMAVVGFTANLLFLLMLALSTAATLIFPACGGR